ncbi:MAG: hypothetical protein PUG26_02840 [Oscillospiraceae bacterium]|nr:hypothetical protein [Oscillospiraceae bacterium]
MAVGFVVVVTFLVVCFSVGLISVELGVDFALEVCTVFTTFVFDEIGLFVLALAVLSISTPLVFSLELTLAFSFVFTVAVYSL